ncbi:hypothetical protein [Streptomyces sp. NBC_01618]|nr:hypothetical protein OH735_25305 [Streptomyces sp. NBC_01618]
MTDESPESPADQWNHRQVEEITGKSMDSLHRRRIETSDFARSGE